MAETNGYNSVSPAGFEHVFQMMCNFVAVAESSSVDATETGLLSLVLYLSSNSAVANEDDFQRLTKEWFGITLDKHRVIQALDTLERRKAIQKTAGRYTLSLSERERIQKGTAGSSELENRVKAKWLANCSNMGVSLNADRLWAALQKYLFYAFRRHGLQTVALIDPRLDVPLSISASLSSLRKNAIHEQFADQDVPAAELALSSFLANIETDLDRSKYVVHLADGAYSFYSLQIDPSLAANLKEGLKELTLYLDTNFLFGLLDMHSHHLVDVSKALVREIADHDLPFKLRYHEATHREARNTLAAIGEQLRRRTWTSALSRAAVQSRKLTGLEQKYHEANAEHGIPVEDFLRPFEYFDKILKESRIEIHRVKDLDLNKKVELWDDYNEYVKQNLHREKPYEAVQHDAIVLDHVRGLRTKRYAPLSAGSLFVTCDYWLYRYEWERARKDHRPACVIMPAQLWQMMRPFVPRDQHFDECFAKTFAIPEFRTIHSLGSKAASRMMQIMASFKGLKPETALTMLRDEMLLGRIAKAKTEEEAVNETEVAFVKRNTELEAEKAAVERDKAATEEELARKKAKERELHGVIEKQASELATSTSRNQRLANRLDETDGEFKRSELERKRIEGERAEAALKLSRIEEEKKQLEVTLSQQQKRNSELEEEKRRTVQHNLLLRCLGCLLASVFVVAGFWLIVHFANWEWLLKKKNFALASIVISAVLIWSIALSFFPKKSGFLWSSGLGIPALMLLLFTLLMD